MGGGGGKGGGGGGTTSTVNVNNMGTTTVDVVGLDDIQADLDLTLSVPDTIGTSFELNVPEPVRTEATNELRVPDPIRTELAITEPIVTDSTSKNSSQLELDVKPLVVDLCLDLQIGKLPPTCIRQPYQHHFGLTFMGMELFGFTYHGESKVIIEDHETGPKVAWGGAEAQPERRSRRKPRKVESRGLRIRLGD
jgi:hypothetical protein